MYCKGGEEFDYFDVQIWKNRAKTAEAKVDNLEELLIEKDEALAPFVEAYRRSCGTNLGEFYDHIDTRDGAKAAEAYYLDKTEGD